MWEWSLFWYVVIGIGLACLVAITVAMISMVIHDIRRENRKDKEGKNGPVV